VSLKLSPRSRGPRGAGMRTSRRVSLLLLAVLTVTITIARPSCLAAQTATAPSLKWSLQVAKVDPGDVGLEPSFQIAIYESLLDELSKRKQFKQILRDGDRNASKVSDLLILKTTVEKYTAGSETQRAVTSVSGATKLIVRSQLCTRDGRVILERRVDGNVRFLGSNLRATHNLARNVAKTIDQSSLPEPSNPPPVESGQL
jgi:hypothetical protein